MRFEEFCLRIPGDEFRMRFHDRLTVVAGIGELEREELLTSVLSACCGLMPGTRFTYVDELGQRVVVTTDDGEAVARTEAGDAVPGILDVLGVSVDELRRRVRLISADLGLRPDDNDLAQHPQLREARAALTAVTDELQAAIGAQQMAEAMSDELASLEERIRRSEEGRARRAYAKVLAELERVRAEAAAVRGGSQSVSADQLLVKRKDEIDGLAEVWEQTTRQAVEAAEAFGDDELLPDEVVGEAAHFPGQVPPELEVLAERYEQLRQEHDQLAEQLRQVAAAHLPDPSDPLVAELARLDQSVLWEAHRSLLEAARTAQLRTLGLPTDLRVDNLDELIDELETAHCDLEAAVEEAEDRKVAKMLVNRRIAEAERREEAALQRLGLTSHLAFHVRRMELSIDPAAREAVEQAVLAHRLAEIRWTELAGDVDPARATDLEAEVRAYAEALQNLEGEADDIERLRRRIEETTRPALEQARSELLAACRPFGIDDTELAVGLVAHQVQIGHAARRQQEVEEARQAQEAAAAALADALFNVGFGDGDLSARLGAFTWAAERAAERERARGSARELEDVEADLARLESEAARLRRPEWSNVTAAEADEPDLDDLKAKREATAAAYQAAVLLVPDTDHLRDRHRAMVRRVSVLESELREQGLLGTGPGERVQQYLMSRLTVSRAGRPDEVRLPVVMDDALGPLEREQKLELLELMERLAERVQVVYLTDDPEVAVWARQRASAGVLTLLEPVEETAGV